MFKIEDGGSKTARQPLTQTREKEFVKELIIKYNHEHARNFEPADAAPLMVKSKSQNNLKEKIQMFRDHKNRSTFTSFKPSYTKQSFAKNMPGIMSDSKNVTWEIESLLKDNLLGGCNKGIIRNSTRPITAEDVDFKAEPPKGVRKKDWNRL